MAPSAIDPPTNEQEQKRLLLKSQISEVEDESDGDRNNKNDILAQSAEQNGHKSNRSSNTNGTTAEKEDTNIMVEGFEAKDGQKLTSIDFGSQREETPKEVEKQKAQPKQGSSQELVSGRQAGKGWDKISFAPLNVPAKRRLQTLTVLTAQLLLPILLTVFLLLCCIPILWPLLLPYLLYVLFSSAPHSGTLSHRSEFFRSLRLWSLFASYFPARLHRSQTLPPTRKYIFGYHPHGIISHGAFSAFATEALGFAQLFPGITNTLLTLDNNFRVPLYRDYALTLGLASVSRESCENILSKGGPNNEGMGRAITIVIGGARESLAAEPHMLRLILKRRKGFVKLALRTGADLVPVLGFGENEIFDQHTPVPHSLLFKVQLMVKNILGFTIPLFHARGVFNYDVGLMPYRRPLNIVVGRPIKIVQQRGNLDDAEVDRIHGLYCVEIQRLWDEWKDRFAGGRKMEMELVD